MKKASSIHSLSTFEGFLNTAVTDTVQLYYDNPESREGKIIHMFLLYLQGEWKLKEIAKKYWRDLQSVEQDFPKGCRTY